MPRFAAGWLLVLLGWVSSSSPTSTLAFLPVRQQLQQHNGRNTVVVATVSSMERIHSNHHHRPFISTTRLHAAAVSIKEVTDEASDRMTKSIDSCKLSLTSIRTGRASASILDRVKVDYYGTATPLNQLAGISVPSAQQLTIDPYDKKALPDIERAIMESDLGLTPSNDGSLIRINIPALTQDRRKELLKQCKAIGEEAKVAVRNVRRDGVDAIKKMEKASAVGQDEMKDGLDVMQKMTDQAIKDIDDIVARKEKEVMTV
jgi:ribosome recycling factor